MDVLLCAARGHRLTGPVRLLDEMPGSPGRDGPPGPGGGRHRPASAARGTHVVGPRPHGAPCEPCPAGKVHDGAAPGEKRTSGERGPLVPAGPRGTRAPHPRDAAEDRPHPERGRHTGRCGGHGMRLVPDTVRAAARAGR